jgi:serine/threonine protein kinase
MDRPQCCFLDPEYSEVPRSLTDICPHCGRPYGFPLVEYPDMIHGYSVVKSLNRGFYSAVFHVTGGAFDSPYVLKISSKVIYEKFAGYGKDFGEECRLHNEVANGSDHLVKILDMFEEDIQFGDVVIPCHVAVLGYVDGRSLEDILAADPPPPSRQVAQIALDLLQLLEELRAKESFHNDLHEGNIIVENLSASSRRAEAIDDSIRTVAIDLGSITDGSKSDAKRLGDLNSVAHYLGAFAERLVLRPRDVSDLDYRLAGQLQEVAALLSSEAVNQRGAPRMSGVG